MAEIVVAVCLCVLVLYALWFGCEEEQ